MDFKGFNMMHSSSFSSLILDLNLKIENMYDLKLEPRLYAIEKREREEREGAL
jgi:hypothetical protein